MNSRLALLPWITLGLLTTGCPLSDPYVIEANGGAGGGSLGGSSAAGAAGDQSGGGGSGDASQMAGSGGISGGSAGSSGGVGGSAGNGGLGGAAASGGASGGGAGAGGTTTGGDSSAGNANGGTSGGGSGGTGGSAGDGMTGGTAGSDSGGSGGVATGGTAGAAGSGGYPACTPAVCKLDCCGTLCTDLSSDDANCGVCGQACEVGRACGSTGCATGWVKMSSPPVGFVGRARAASVAVGKSMFVWGGGDASGNILDTGALYSPVDDTWKVIKKDANTPTPRVFATAVWTGSVVIVYGGTDGANTTYNDGGIYDPSSDSWVDLPSAASKRGLSVGIWDGTRAVFWGGTDATGAAVTGADRFNLSTWSAASTKFDPGALAGPAWAWDGATLYLGGGVSGTTRTDKVESYGTAGDIWAGLSKSLSARSNAFGVWDGSHFVIWGGRDDFAPRNDGKYFAGGNTWTALSASGVPSARFAPWRRVGWSFEIKPGTVAFIGGQTSLAGAFALDGASYDVGAAKWTKIPQFPSGEEHDYGAAVWNGEEFLIWGGRKMGTSTATGERWRP